MRVLIQTACYCVLDGVTATIRKIEAHLLKHHPGAHVCILTTKSGDLRNLDNVYGLLPDDLVPSAKARRSVIFVKALKLPINYLNYRLGLRLSAHDINLMDKFDPTVVHSTVPDLLCLDLIQYSRDRNLPLLATFHTNHVLYMEYYQALWIQVVLEHYFRHMYSFIPELYVPTEYYRQLVSTSTLHFNRCTDVKIWGRGVDMSLFKPSNRSEGFRRQHGVKPHEVLITYVGRLVPEKSPDVFIDVLKRLKNTRGIHIRGLVIGDGPCQQDIAEHAIWPGWLPPSDLAVAYASSDIFFFPSGSETFGNVSLEACASGLPIVVEDGCSSHLVDGNGIACKRGDTNEYYNAVLRITKDKELRKKMSQRSLVVATRYKIETVMEDMVNIYKNAKSSGDFSLPDNEFNFPWGRQEHPFVLQLVEGVFWILVTATVKIVQTYEVITMVPIFARFFERLSSLLPKTGKPIFLQGGIYDKVSSITGRALAFMVLYPLQCKEIPNRMSSKSIHHKR